MILYARMTTHPAPEKTLGIAVLMFVKLRNATKERRAIPGIGDAV